MMMMMGCCLAENGAKKQTQKRIELAD